MTGFAADHEGADVRVSPNFGPRRGPSRPDMIVLHYTGMATGAAAEAWLCDPASEVSSHYVVHEDGRVVQLVRESDPAAYRQRSFELSVAGYFADPRRARDLTPFRVVGRVQQSVWGSLGDFDLTPAMVKLDVPALVVHGRQDPIPLASSESVAQALRARLVVLENCGHVPYVEQPQSLFDAVRQFLTELSPARGHTR